MPHPPQATTSDFDASSRPWYRFFANCGIWQVRCFGGSRELKEVAKGWLQPSCDRVVNTVPYCSRLMPKNRCQTRIMAESALLLQAAATLAMVGLIWFVQVVHYPLFSRVGGNEFSAYERAHQALTSVVVIPLMLVEALTATLLLWIRPEGVAILPAIVGIVLVAVVWASTFFWQVPAHAKLEASFNESTHRWLVRSNWVRTAGWTGRGMLVCWMISRCL